MNETTACACGFRCDRTIVLFELIFLKQRILLEFLRERGRHNGPIHIPQDNSNREIGNSQRTAETSVVPLMYVGQ